MEDIASLRGHWWLPDNTEHRFRGVLRVRKNGACELISEDAVGADWYTDRIRDNHGWGSVDAVHGTTNGRAVTVLVCSMPLHFRGNPHVSLVGKAAVVGAWVADIDDERFTEMFLDIDNLGHFADDRFQLALGDMPSLDGPQRPVLHYQPVAPVVAVVDDLRISLQWHPAANIDHGPGSRRVTFEEFVKIRISSDKPQSVYQLGEVARLLQDLLTFATGQACGIRSTLVRVPDEQRTGESSGLADLFGHRRQPPAGQADIVHSSSLPLRLSDTTWGELVPRWFDLHARFRGIIGTLLGQLFQPGQYVDNRALHLVTGIEQTYRALNKPEHAMTDGQHRRLRRIVRQAVGEDPELAGFADRCAEQIGRGVDLDTRIRAVMAHIGPLADEIFRSPGAVESWIVAAKRSRNQLAHRSHADYETPALGTIARGARAVLVTVLLTELGISVERQREVVREHHRHVAEDVGRYLPESVPVEAVVSDKTGETASGG